MKLLIIFGITLIIIHGFWPNFFTIDTITVLIFFVLLLPFLAPYLKRAKIPGAEFEFKEKIEEAKKTVQYTVEKAKEDERTGKYKISRFETFKVSTAKKLLEIESDPALALASLRMEIEKKLRIITDFLNIKGRDDMPISLIMEKLGERQMLHSEQIKALREIIALCNKAIHGYDVKKDEAKEIIDLVNWLNRSVGIGYSIDVSRNKDYRKHGLFCEWEHCIEWMPLTEKSTKKSCLVFGHNCPGGTERVLSCGKTIEDFPQERFIKESH